MNLLPRLAALLLLLLTGCSILPKPQADPTRYYVLSGPPLTANATTTATTPGPSTATTPMTTGGAVLGLAHVKIASYLNGKAMIVRTAEHELAFENYARWAEPLDLGIRRMLAARLATAPSVQRVFVQPYPFDVTRDYDLHIEVLRCEGQRTATGANATLACTVEIVAARGDGRVLQRKVFTAPAAAWDGKDYGELARLLSVAIEQLADDIVATLPAPPVPAR